MKALTQIWKLAIWTVAIIFAILFFQKITPDPKPEFVEVVKYDTIPGDSIPYPVNHYLPGKYSIIHDTIPSDIDTLAILKDYFSRAYYCDTITDDTTFLLVLHDIISKNTIVSREASYKNLKPTVVKTITLTPESINQFFIGSEIYMNRNSQNLYITGTMCSKNGKIYTLGFDPINKGFNAGFAVNIKNLRK